MRTQPRAAFAVDQLDAVLVGPGRIEQAADVVIFLHRDEVYDPNTPNKGVIEMIVRKNRHGNCGTAYGKASFDVSRIDDMPRGFRPTFSAPAPSSRSRFQGDQGF